MFIHCLHVYKKIIVWKCRAFGLRSSLSTRILGLWPKPRIRISPRRRSLSEETVLMNKKVSLGHSGLKGWAEDGTSSTRQSQGLER